MKIIVFEGIDGSGKTTQARLLYNKLFDQGKRVVLLREPGGTAASEGIRNILKDAKTPLDPLTELFLFEAARIQLFKEYILPLQNEKITIILDRFIYSTIAYQGYGRGLAIPLIKYLNEIATDGIKPDMVFLLDIPVLDAIVRTPSKESEKDRFDSEYIQFHQRVRDGFLVLARLYPEGWRILNGLSEQEVLRENIYKEVTKPPPRPAMPPPPDPQFN